MEEIENIVPPSVDYTELLESIISNQQLIIEHNQSIVDSSEDIKFLRDYFEITEEEQKVIDEKAIKENNIKQESDVKLKELEKKESFELMLDSPYSIELGEIKEQLIQLNKSSVDNIEVDNVGATANYLLLFGLVGTILCYGIYRCFIKPFIY